MWPVSHCKFKRSILHQLNKDNLFYSTYSCLLRKRLGFCQCLKDEAASQKKTMKVFLKNVFLPICLYYSWKGSRGMRFSKSPDGCKLNLQSLLPLGKNIRRAIKHNLDITCYFKTQENVSLFYNTDLFQTQEWWLIFDHESSYLHLNVLSTKEAWRPSAQEEKLK